MNAPSSHVPPRPQRREGPLARALALVRLLAAAGRSGAALSTLAQQTGLPPSTVHRLLAHLLSERLAIQLEEGRRYAIGPLAYELGLVAAQQFDIRALCRPALERLAAETAETVYLLQRSGNEAVCLDLQQGPTTIRVVTLQVGSRRPLGLGAGGLAILAALPAAEGDELLDALAPVIERDWGFPSELLRGSVVESREQGFALIRNRITPGVTAIGMSFNDSLGHVFGAITVAGLNARMAAARLQGHRERLARATAQIERTLRGQSWARYETRT